MQMCEIRHVVSWVLEHTLRNRVSFKTEYTWWKQEGVADARKR